MRTEPFLIALNYIVHRMTWFFFFLHCSSLRPQWDACTLSPPPFSSSCATTSDDTICYHHLLWLWLLLFTALCTVIEVHLHVLLRAFAYSRRRRGSRASTGNCHLNWWHSHSGFFFSSSGYDFYSLKSWPCVGIRLFMISTLSVTWWVNEWIAGESEGDDGQKESPKMDLGWKFGSEFLSHGLNINNRFRLNGNTFGCEVLWCVREWDWT